MQPNLDGPAGSGSPEPDARLSPNIAPAIEQAQRAFRRELPNLLRERPGQWVAYHGEKRVGFATTKTALYQDCLRRGLRRDEFLVRSIEPEVDEITVGFDVIDE
jgi:hypothetical protein